MALKPAESQISRYQDDGGLQACNRSAAYHVPCWVAKPLLLSHYFFAFAIVEELFVFLVVRGAAFMRMLASSSSGFLYQKQRPLWAWNVYYSVSTDLSGFAWLRLYGDTSKPDRSKP